MRLIDADALLEIIRTLCRDLWEDVWNFFDGKPHRSRDYLRGLENGYWEIKKDIEQLPTIDAVQVVRCEDCSHYGKDCVLLFPADGYCYDGKRRDNDTD